MEIEDIKKAPEATTLRAPQIIKTRSTNAIKDASSSRVVSQAPLSEHSLPDTTATEHHPYRSLQHMLGDVLVMLHAAANQYSKPRCVETVKTAANYIKRIYRIHRSLFRSGAADPQYPRTPSQITRIKGYIRDILKKAGERLTLNKSLTQFLSLHGIKETIKEPTELIAEAHERLVSFIEGDKGVSSK